MLVARLSSIKLTQRTISSSCGKFTNIRRNYSPPFGRISESDSVLNEKSVTVTVNGNPVIVPRDSNIIEACKKAKVRGNKIVVVGSIIN